MRQLLKDAVAADFPDYTEMAHELDFPEGELDHTDFLTILGYSPDPDTDGCWWSKRR
jgi:hypothetical protein